MNDMKLKIISGIVVTSVVLSLTLVCACKSTKKNVVWTEGEKLLFDHFSPRISRFQLFAYAIGERDYLDHKSHGLDLVISGKTNIWLECLEASKYPPITVCFLPMDSSTDEPIVTYATRYNWCRINDADTLYITGKKADSLAWLITIGQYFYPLNNECTQRIADIESMLAPDKYKLKYQPYELGPPFLTKALLDLGKKGQNGEPGDGD